jgi:ABC-type cobalamin/Fe3+-siderophores transport system ATPase subunit
MKYNFGSIWRKWDLHVHTPFSKLNNGFGEDWDVYVKTLFKKAIEKEISVIGITDYFSIDGYKKIKQDYLDNDSKLKELFSNEEIDKIRAILLLPNVEFRLDRFVGKNRINYHVIFSNEIQINDIEENFLHDLDFIIEGKQFEIDEKLKLKTSNLITVGKKLRAEHDKFQEIGDDLYVGMMNAVVKDEQITNLLVGVPSKFKDKYLICIAADEDLSKVDWNGQDHLARKVLIQKSNAIFSGNPKTSAWACGNNDYDTMRKFSNEFKSLKPCLWGSDSHDYEKLFEPDLKRYLWVKSDPTFEGLRQTMFEPYSRIKIQEQNPELNRLKISIDSIEIKNSNNFPIKNEVIKLNRDLVCIIGGRGSGKSSLLETIAYCFGKHKFDENYKNQKYDNLLGSNNLSFIQSYQKKGNATANFIIKYNDLDGNLIQETDFDLKDRKSVSSLPIIYLGQNQIESVTSNKEEIHALAFKTIIQNSESFSDFSEIENEIKSMEADLISVNKDIESLRLTYKNFSLEKKNEEKERIKKELALLESKETKEIIGQLKIARDKKDSAIRIKSNNQKIKNKIKDFLEEINPLIKETNTSIKTLSLEEFVQEFDFSNFIKSLIELETKVEELGLEKTYNETTSKVQLQLKDISDVSVSYIERLKSQLDIIDNEIANYIKDKEYLDSVNSNRLETLKFLSESYVEYAAMYNEEIKEFIESNNVTLNSIKLDAQFSFDLPKLFNALFDLVDKRKIKTIEKYLESVLDSATFNFSNYSQWVADFTTKKENYEVFYDSNPSSIDEILYKNYFTLNTTIRYEVEPSKYKLLEELSLGQKGTVLLKIYLSTGNNCPIIIDQPEDHLDNDFIYSDLVSTLRSVKEKRQIIIVSHDANLVVNGDAEQVIVAKYENGTISHELSGSIENEIIRSKITNILEGGDEAFKKREKKYQLNIN